ncbi:MAG: GDP-mannose 4,6-dehydratase [Flavobacterium sp.]|uniref:GDP-mannose 4,6-dehydratase n=1 Tax=Flavobacterium sp. TaxID=239 RepID=UPI0022BDC9DD|nr:GDP-mannose 4,6-dehydratase [Flavobacterium sp.]MCZ8197460.1 GDP-mannose 4,6-dehydratase [Flavobacterium sp.]
MDSLSNKVVITGIGGFTGKYLSEYLTQKGYNVFGISNLGNKENKTYKCDITDKSEVETVLREIQPNYIIHLAAISFVQHNDIQEIYNVNVIGTQNILEACLIIKESLKKVILASSATVYGNNPNEMLSEDMCPNPINHYGISKLAMEQVAKTYFTNLPILITRPFNYTAPGHGEQFVIPKIAKAFVNKEKQIELGNLNVYREYNAIEFVCDVYFKLLESETTSAIVNIASGNTYSLNDILSKFEEKSGHRIEVIVNPNFVRKDEIKILKGDISKLKSIINVEFSNSIDSTIVSFLSKTGNK